MSTYPLSAQSSKKLDKDHSSTIQMSSHLRAPEQLNKQDYCHILAGQRIYVELYYNGRIINNEYERWVQIMGGTALKRMSRKMTIFLTNNESPTQVKLVLERAKKISPNCEVLSILWIEECFHEKKKVQYEQHRIVFEETIVLKPGKKKKFTFSQAFANYFLEDFTADARDLNLQFKMNPFVRYVGKNEKINPGEVLIKEVELGQRNRRKSQRKEGKPTRNIKRIKTVSPKEACVSVPQIVVSDKQEQIDVKEISAPLICSLRSPIYSKYLKHLQVISTQDAVKSEQCALQKTKTIQFVESDERDLTKSIRLDREQSRSQQTEGEVVGKSLRGPISLSKRPMHSESKKWTHLQSKTGKQTPGFGATQEAKPTKDKQGQMGEEEVLRIQLLLESSVELNQLNISSRDEQISMRCRKVHKQTRKINFIRFQKYKQLSRERRVPRVNLFLVVSSLADLAQYFLLSSSNDYIKLISQKTFHTLQMYYCKGGSSEVCPPFNTLRLKINADRFREKNVAVLQSACVEKKELREIVELLQGNGYNELDYVTSKTNFDVVITSRQALRSPKEETITEEEFLRAVFSVEPTAY